MEDQRPEPPTARAPRRVQALPSWLANQVAAIATRTTLQSTERPSLRSDFTVLAGVEEFGPISQADLGRRLGMDRSNVFDVLDRLQGHGSVSRQADPADRRRNVIEITARGHERLEELTSALEAAQEGFLDPLDDGERATFVALLRRLVEHHRR